MNSLQRKWPKAFFTLWLYHCVWRYKFHILPLLHNTQLQIIWSFFVIKCEHILIFDLIYNKCQQNNKTIKNIERMIGSLKKLVFANSILESQISWTRNFKAFKTFGWFSPKIAFFNSNILRKNTRGG